MYLVRNFGAIKHAMKGEYNSMRVTTIIKTLNKKNGKYTARDGSERESFKVTYSQEDDNIVGEMTVRKDAFDMIEKGKEFELLGEYVITKTGNYITWVSAKPIINNGKAVL